MKTKQTIILLYEAANQIIATEFLETKQARWKPKKIQRK